MGVQEGGEGVWHRLKGSMCIGGLEGECVWEWG